MPASIISSSTTTPKKQKIRVVVRNANEEDWLKVDPKFDKGEIIATLDKNTLKIGDGVHRYSELPDISGGSDIDLSKIVNKADELPEASADNIGDVYMYSGESNSSFIHGYIYESIATRTATDVSFGGNIISSWPVEDFVRYLQEGGSRYNEVTHGTLTYDSVASLWILRGFDENNMEVISFQEYTEDLEDYGCVFSSSTHQEGDSCTFELTTEIDSYVWKRLDVQPASQGGGAVDSVNGKTGVVILDASDVGALPDTTVIPTTTSDLVNDSGFITGINSTDVTSALGYTPVDPSDLSTVATTGDYDDLINKPVLGTAAAANATDFATAAQGTKADNAESDIGDLSNLSTTSKSDLVSAINEVYSDATSSVQSVTEGTTDGTINVDGVDVSVHGLGTAAYTNSTDYDAAGSATAAATAAEMAAKAYADSLGANYATAAQGVKADTALQPGDDVSELNNDAGYITGITSSDVTSALGYSPVDPSSLATVATTGSYNDLSDKPYIPVGVVVDQVYDANSQNAQAGIAVAEAVSTKQDIIPDLSAIRSGATLGTTAVQPGDLAAVATSGDYNDLSNKPTIPAAQVNSDWNSSSGVSEILNKPDLSVYALDSDVADIQDLIPSAATDQNQLADKAFVNSSISNMAANYVTSDAQGDNFATRAALIAGPYYYKGASYTPTNNDYALVEADENHNGATTRYMYDGVQWNFQYVVNNSPFSQTQLDAINSGITAAKVTGYDSLVSNVQADWNASSGLAQILNKPTLGTAAYADSTDFATAAEGALADTAVQPGDLATVATTGAYSDLTGTPTIPTVGDGTITFTQGGVTKGTFTTNQSGNTTIALDAGGGDPLPSQAGHDGEFLTTDGTDPSWGVATAVTFREWGGNE